MTEEQAFLDAIKANPSDRALRLIYADWLEERGDERAAALRVDSVGEGRCPVCACKITSFAPRRRYARLEWKHFFVARCAKCKSGLITDGDEPNIGPRSRQPSVWRLRKQ